MPAQLVSCRYVEPRDREVILAIEEANHHFGNGRDERAWDHGALLRFVEMDRTRLVVLEAAGKVVGFLGIDARLPEAAGDHREAGDVIITRLSVLPHRQGYGRALLAEAHRIAAMAEGSRLVAPTYDIDTDAHRFFHAMGWTGRPSRNHYGRHLPAVVFVCPVVAHGQ